MRSRLLALLLGIASLFMAAIVLAPPDLGQGLPSGPGRCSGSFVNPVTDVCWGCMFPLPLGSFKIWPSSRADTDNPDLPICACGTFCARASTLRRWSTLTSRQSLMALFLPAMPTLPKAHRGISIQASEG